MWSFGTHSPVEVFMTSLGTQPRVDPSEGGHSGLSSEWMSSEGGTRDSVPSGRLLRGALGTQSRVDVF